MGLIGLMDVAMENNMEHEMETAITRPQATAKLQILRSGKKLLCKRSELRVRA